MAQKEKLKKPIFTLVLICFLFFMPFLIKPQILTTKNNDLGRNYIPLFTFIKKASLADKGLPYWRGDQLMGESLIANPVSTLFYPMNLVFIILPIGLAAVLYLLSHYIISAISTFLLAKSFSLSQKASFFAAIFYTFSTKNLLHTSAGHITMVAAFSYFPIFVLCLRKITIWRNSKFLILGSVSLSFMLLLYPTVAYYAVIFSFIYFFYLVLKNHPTHFFKRFRVIVLLYLIGFGLSCIFLLPQIEFGPLSTRDQLKIEDVAQPLWNFNKFSQSLFLPYPILSDIDHESFLYFGIIPSIFLIAGFFRLPIRQKIILSIFAVLTLVYVAGLSTPIFKLAYNYVPLLKFSRVTTRIWFVVALLVSLIASFGISKVKSKKLIYLLVAIFICENLYIGYRKIFSVEDLSFQNEQLYMDIAVDKEPYRIYCTSYCLNPQLISKYNLTILNGENPIQDKQIVSFLQKAGNYTFSGFAVIFPPYQVWQKNDPPIPDPVVLGKANVKYVASTYTLNEQNLFLINIYSKIYLYRNLKFLPRVYGTNPSEQILLKRKSNNKFILYPALSQKASNIIVAEKFLPGWGAKDNLGRAIKVEREDIFLKVYVPRNTGSITLSYRPLSFVFGGIMTGSTILLLTVYFWYSRKR